MNGQTIQVTCNADIFDGAHLVAKAGQEITVTFDPTGAVVYIPVSSGGYIIKPACFVTKVQE